MSNILVILNVITLVILLVILLKQFLSSANHKRIEANLLQTEKSNHLAQQQLRENLLTTVSQFQQSIIEKLNNDRLDQVKQNNDFKEQVQEGLNTQRMRFDERQLDALKILQDTLQKGAQDNRAQVKEALANYATELGKRVEQLTATTENKLKEINDQVEKRLNDGFAKTNETFTDVIKRLALIDAAQQKISELSTNVVSLQEILNDKRSRGAFGEVQLSSLIHNMIPKQNVSFQHLLSNHRRPDCMLFLPEPTGNIAIDAKFPLENYRLLIDAATSEIDRQQAVRQFKIDIRKHIQDIADKYIIPGETADGAMMFIPAEAIFAEIHAHHPDLVEFGQQAKVWLVSPTTMMAILTTARAVLKDAATRKQVHEIQKHLRLLAEDFERFQTRMDSLAKRIAQTHTDIDQIHTSSRKITQRFIQIDRAEFAGLELENPLIPTTEVGT